MPAFEQFCHLHVHSHFSLLDGAATVKKLVSAAKACDMPALALTDHGNLFGAVQFYRECRDQGIKPIIGMEAYVSPGARTERKRTPQGAFFHFILWAKDFEGYQNLMKLSSIGYLEGFYYRPRIDKEVLREHSAGLIGSSACLSSPINRAALSGTEEELRSEIEAFRDIFAPGCFYLELQRNGLAEQDRILEKIPPLAKEYGLPLVGTNDIHYLQRSDARAQEVHLCINTGQTMDDTDRMRFHSDQFYFRNQEEMGRVLGDWPECLENTLRIAEECNVEIDFDTTHLPPFIIESNETQDEYFRRLCEEGCRELYPDFDTNEAAKERLEYEIAVIARMGYVNYFLIVADFIRYARDNDIPVGPGRGSAAGSIVAYALKITQVDPLKYDLLFERFLNEDRISMPDIDIDFCMDGRERVIEYVRQKYGEEKVSQIITFGTMAAKAVVRDVGRVLGIPLSEVDKVTKKIDPTPGAKLQASLESDPDLIKMRKSDPKLAELFDLSLRLEGLNRHCSTHAAGVVIGDAPLIDMIPLYKNGDDITSQWTMEVLESVGMLKMDFLGLRTLTIIDRCLREVRKTQGVEIDIDTIPLDDAKTFELLCRGDAKAVFQLESDGMRNLLRNLKPDRFEDIVALLALYRPGPLNCGMDKTYVNRKHGLEPVTYAFDELEPILGETFGVILYQEQVMRIAQVIGAFTLNQADSLRKAMGKKKPEIMAKFTDQFIDGARGNGHDGKGAKHLFEQIQEFAAYGFNKSHSVAYGFVSYQTAYLKANYPTEFMAAVMTCEMSNTDKIVEYLEECRNHMGIEIMPPNINRSEKDFSVTDGKIWYGLEAVKGIGGKVVDHFVEARRKEGDFKSIYDICERVDGQGLSKAVLEALTSCGALDVFEKSRSQLAAVIEPAFARGAEARKDRAAGQLTFFAAFGANDDEEEDGEAFDETYPDIPEWDEEERLSREKQTLGFYLSGHPLDRWMPLIRKFTRRTISELEGAGEGTVALLGVQISKIQKRVSKRTGNAFWIANVEDKSGSLELFIDAKLYEAYGDELVADKICFVRGKVKYRETSMNFRVEKIFPVEAALTTLTSDLSIDLDLVRHPDCEDLLFKLKQLLMAYHGRCPVYLLFRNERSERAIVQVGEEVWVRPDLELFLAVEELCGKNTILVNRMGRAG